MAENFVDKNGVPVLYLGKRGDVMISTSPPQNASSDNTPSSDIKDADFLKIGKYTIAPWFDAANKHPWDTRTKYLRKSSVLKSAIGYKTELAVSQGIFAAKINGYNADGSEIFESVKDKKFNNFLKSRQIRKSQQAAYQNLYSFGNGFVQVILAKNRKDVSVVESLDSIYCRFGEKNKKGAKDKVFFNSLWHEKKPSESALQTFNCIDTRMPIELQMEQAKKLGNFIFPLNFHTAGSIYYADEPWLPAQESGHLDITLKVAQFTNSLFDNQISIKYHVQIPYSYWESLFPISDYPSPKNKEERQQLITQRLDLIEEDLCSATNSRKTIFSHYNVGEDGKTKDGWIITVIDDKLTSQHYLPQAAASNAEVFTSMGINPSVKGLQMAAGPYANSSGGSNIREAFLIDSGLAWGDRQEFNDLANLLIRLMGADEDVEIRTKATVLTTLDTGAGTKKTVS